MSNRDSRIGKQNFWCDWIVKETKLTELEDKIPDVSSLTTKIALTAVENKIPSFSSSVKK